jgi:hypothetical protein
MAPRLITRAELARLGGVSRPAVTKLLRGSLKAAAQGDRVDAAHHAVRAWLASKGKADAPRTAKAKPTKKTQAAPTAVSSKAPKEPPAPPAVRPTLPEEQPAAPTQELDAFADLLRPLVERFGTSRTFRDWLGSLKEIEAIIEKRLANEERQGRLVSRELVQTHVLGLIDAGNRRLLDDATKSIARRIHGAVKSDGTVEGSEQIVRDILESHLGPVKTNAVRLLSEAV